MLFDTPIFFLFLCLTVLCYWCLNFRAQNKFLLIASYFFYGWWDWRFLCLMIASTVIDYLIAIKIADTKDQRLRRSLLILSLVINFSILGFFKYFNFFADSLHTSLSALGFQIALPLLRIILPPGISFYTFQEVAYIVDVYAGRVPASRSFFDYGLFISLFPHLIAGPIQRPSHLLPQVQKPRQWDSDKVFDGLLLILEGLLQVCHRRQLRAHRECRFWRCVWPAKSSRGAARNLRFRVADIRRLQRVQQHCAGKRTAHGIPLHG